jgi:putative NADH-flavin reductase
MKLLIFGAGGGIGRHTMAQALEAGHTVTVTAAVRRPASIELKHECLTVVRGDITDAEAVKSLMPGHDAAVSTIGTMSRASSTLFTDGLGNVVAAMKSAGINRLLCISASGLDPGPFIQRLIAKPLLWWAFKNHYDDLVRMEAIVSASGLAWTIIRPPRLTDGPRTGRYKIAINKHAPNSWLLSRADVADFIVKHLDNPATFQTIVEVAY